MSGQEDIIITTTPTDERANEGKKESSERLGDATGKEGERRWRRPFWIDCGRRLVRATI
jgi:hypothetical protein